VTATGRYKFLIWSLCPAQGSPVLIRHFFAANQICFACVSLVQEKTREKDFRVFPDLCSNSRFNRREIKELIFSLHCVSNLKLASLRNELLVATS
jgi:hypothetical protein